MNQDNKKLFRASKVICSKQIKSSENFDIAAGEIIDSYESL